MSCHSLAGRTRPIRIRFYLQGNDPNNTDLFFTNAATYTEAEANLQQEYPTAIAVHYASN